MLNNPIIQTHLRQAASLLANIERQFRSRATASDDSDVVSFLKVEADRASVEMSILAGYAAGDLRKDDEASWLQSVPTTTVSSRIIEEQTLFDLIFAFSALNAKRASFAVLMQIVADQELRAKLVEGLDDASKAAFDAFHLLPTRSKIAFNMLTPNEIDPAVETRSASAKIT